MVPVCFPLAFTVLIFTLLLFTAFKYVVISVMLILASSDVGVNVYGLATDPSPDHEPPVVVELEIKTLLNPVVLELPAPPPLPPDPE